MAEGGRGSIPWARVVTEGFVIVVSILLAFGIEAWWQGQGEQEEARDSLEIVLRDLSAAQDQLVELAEFAEGSSDAALDAYAALSGDLGTLDRTATTNLLIRSLSRRTMQLPRAGYTDLLNTGTLGLIDDRELRDAIVQFYETAERSQTIFEKNSDQFIDGHLDAVLVGGGLIIVRPTGVGTPLQVFRDSVVRERLGDIPHPPDPLWDLPADAREWDRLRTILLSLGRTTRMQAIILEDLIEQAVDVQDRIRARLE